MSIHKRLERLEQIVKPAADWRAYAAAHGLSEREIAEEALAILQSGDHSYDAETVQEAMQSIESILGASGEYTQTS